MTASTSETGNLQGPPPMHSVNESVAERPPQLLQDAERTPWGNYDIGEEGLAWALSRSRRPEQLNALVSLARKH